MLVKIKNSESKKFVGLKCQCQPKAVERKGSLLRKIICKNCGKVFKTNKYIDICFGCEKLNDF